MDILQVSSGVLQVQASYFNLLLLHFVINIWDVEINFRNFKIQTLNII